MSYDILTIANGTYEGIWGGYEIKFNYNRNPATIQTKLGIRGFNIPVRFKVTNNQVEEKDIVIL